MINVTRRRSARYLAETATLVTAVVLAGGAAVGMIVTYAAETNDALTADAIVSVYVLALLVLSQLVPWLTPRRRGASHDSPT